MTSWTLRLLAVLACGMGVLWILQGIGLLSNATSPGDVLSTLMGLIVLVVGVALYLYSFRLRRSRF